MKRIISLVLVAAVLVVSLAVPSFAAENQWFNVLDFTTPNNSGTTITTVSPGGSITFDVPRMEGGYFDLVIQFRTTVTDMAATVTNGSYTKTLNVVRINSVTYRLYGYVGLNFQTGIKLTLNFSGSSWNNVFDVSFLSFRVTNVLKYSFDTPVDVIAYFHGSITSSFTYSGTATGISIPGASVSTQDDVRIYCDFPDWKSYDYIELYVVAREIDISSIAACLTNEIVPCSVSYLNTNNASDNSYITISCDLTGISRDSSEPLEIAITGRSIYLDSNNGYFGVMFATGYLDNAGLSQFAQLRLSLSRWFSDLKSGIVGSINTWGQNIVDAITGDSSKVDQFQDLIEQGNQELDDMAAVMDSFTTPDINSINVDVGSFVTPSDINSLTSPMTLLFDNSIITTCIMISIILATVMFVLYGKR